MHNWYFLVAGFALVEVGGTGPVQRAGRGADNKTVLGHNVVLVYTSTLGGIRS